MSNTHQLISEPPTFFSIFTLWPFASPRKTRPSCRGEYGATGWRSRTGTFRTSPLLYILTLTRPNDVTPSCTIHQVPSSSLFCRPRRVLPDPSSCRLAMVPMHPSSAVSRSQCGSAAYGDRATNGAPSRTARVVFCRLSVLSSLCKTVLSMRSGTVDS